MSFGVTKRASSCRSRFSRRIFSEYGSRDTFGNACSSLLRLKISTGSLARVHCVFVSKEFMALITLILSNQRVWESSGVARVVGVAELKSRGVWESAETRRVVRIGESKSRPESMAVAQAAACFVP